MIDPAGFMAKARKTHATAGNGLGRSIWPLVVAACLALDAGEAAAADDVVADDAVARAVAQQGNAVVVGANGFVFAANVNVRGVAVAANAGNNADNINKQVDQWFFPRGQVNQKRAALESPLALALAELHRACHLSDAQSKKLALAMEYDVTRFFDDVDALRRQFLRAGVDNEQIRQDLAPLRMKLLNGELCGPDSFFAKTVSRVLDGEQLSRYQTIVNQRQRRRYLTLIELALQELEQRCPLDDWQYETIRRLLADQPLPRVVIDDRNTVLLITYRLSRIPAEKLQPLFDAVAWEAFQWDRGRFATSGDRLKQMGLLEGEE
ncbi:MAG TPA: hypothetical protein VHY91_15695 [Pirellulales bacterium]|jgi:hypothetical protein|nr:hypothetical protein [Pirellulales bacterium]